MKNVAWKLDDPFDGISSRITTRLDADVTTAFTWNMEMVYDVQEFVIREVQKHIVMESDLFNLAIELSRGKK